LISKVLQPYFPYENKLEKNTLWRVYFSMGENVIYKITNIENGKIYIGSAVDINVRKRKHLSLLRRSIHPNKHLQSAFNKYGEEKFLFSIVEHVENSDELLIREQYYIDSLQVCDNKVGYNQATFADNPMKGRKHSPKSLKRISEVTRGSNNGFYGRRHNEKTKEKMKLKKLGKVLSDDHKEKVSESLKKPVVMLDKQGNFIRKFKSATDVGKELNISSCHISSCCKGKRLTTAGHKWMYLEEYEMLKSAN